MKPRHELPQVAEDFLATSRSPFPRAIVGLFHRWMSHHQITLDALVHEHIERFLDCPAGNAIALPTRDVYRCQVRRYLAWLNARGLIGFAPKRLRSARPKPDRPPRVKRVLPPTAKEFLRTPDGRHAYRVVGVFHHWMDKHRLQFVDLAPEHIDRFLDSPSGTPITSLTRNDYRYKIRRYLDWLNAHRLIGFNANWLRMRRARLCEPAEDFLRSLDPTLKPATCQQYRNSLRTLYGWMDEQGISMETLGRREMQAWLQHLHARGQSAATRVNIIVAVRVYLRSLNDAGLLEPSADELIRHSDLPKLPIYLPRPLEPDTDQALRERLANSQDPLQRGLLVMRNTGLRLGELRSLAVDCLRSDDEGNHFLKVPLGKMNKERLVPVDDQTLALIRDLQKRGRADRRWLIETKRGRQTRAVQFSVALELVTQGLETSENITSHRLRHTYATTLMNAGMSLMGIMKLLGHRDYRMTLRYTEITLETVGAEYKAALVQLEHRYRLALQTPGPRKLDPDAALNAIIRYVQKRAGDQPAQQRRAELLVKRLRRIREEVGEL